MAHSRAGGKVDRKRPTRFGRTMKQLGIEMIAAYSPQARGHSERTLLTHQDRLVKELAAAGITDMEQGNACLRKDYLPHFNAEFMRPPRAQGCAFVPCRTLQYLTTSCANTGNERSDRTTAYSTRA